jgi:Dyp-type peroxidase family
MVDQIQGNIFPGFLKDFQTLLFLQIVDAPKFRKWLGSLIPRIATMEMVVAFNRLHKHIRHQHQSETAAPKITWLNMAFSFHGLQKLLNVDYLNQFEGQAFIDGLYKRSCSPISEGYLGDPVDPNSPGYPDNWLIGGKNNEADVILIVAGDDACALNQEVARLESTIFSSSRPQGQWVTSGAQLIFRQDGATLSGRLRGHEHFGFRDGISQPGIRGKLPDGTYLTPNQNPRNIDQGKPGQDLVWPGEFVFGYQGQDQNNSVTPDVSKFTTNGSFLVFRRLRQDVGMFHRFLKSTANDYGVAPHLVGARMMGRWASGAPGVRRHDSTTPPDQDDLELAHEDCRNNYFHYAKKDSENERQHHEGDCREVPLPPHDSHGKHVPVASHIRKSFPRDQDHPGIAETQKHRLLRRGIPYGQPSRSTPDQPLDDDIDRGLLFLAYQVSIENQFEFITRIWLNDADFPLGASTGHDPIVGQNSKGDGTRDRSFNLNLPDPNQPGQTKPISTAQEWVVPTGGGYFFAPSIKALGVVKGDDPAPTAKTA